MNKGLAIPQGGWRSAWERHPSQILWSRRRSQSGWADCTSWGGLGSEAQTVTLGVPRAFGWELRASVLDRGRGRGHPGPKGLPGPGPGPRRVQPTSVTQMNGSEEVALPAPPICRQKPLQALCGSEVMSAGGEEKALLGQ